MNGQAQVYWARPYAVRWVDSHFGGTFKFETLDEAYAYIQEQWRRINERCAFKTHGGSWIGSDLGHSHLETPEGRVQLRYVLLAADVSNRP